MLIAHIPAGYIISKPFNKDKKLSITLSSMIFSILPDLGLIYFYFFDSTISHRTFFPHLPIVMLIAFMITFPFYHLKFFEKFRIYYWLFFANWFIHLVLDTITERIFWMYPFSEHGFMLIEIPAVYDHWITSFVLHWSFALEIAIVVVAIVLLLRKGHMKDKKLRSYR